MSDSQHCLSRWHICPRSTHVTHLPGCTSHTHTHTHTQIQSCTFNHKYTNTMHEVTNKAWRSETKCSRRDSSTGHIDARWFRCDNNRWPAIHVCDDLSSTGKEIGWEQRLQYDLFFVECRDVRPKPSTNHSTTICSDVEYAIRVVRLLTCHIGLG